MPCSAAFSSARAVFIRSVMASRLAAGYLPLAAPGWFDTRTTGSPSSFNRWIALATPGSSLNSSTDRGESGPSELGTSSLMTPSRSTKTALFTLDSRPEAVNQEVMENHVDAFHDRRAEFVDQDGHGQAVVRHLRH